MIARIWIGETRKAQSDAYLDYLKKTGVRGCRGTAGNRGVWILRRLKGDRAEFTFVSLWDSLAAIRKFAGPDAGRAVYYPEDRAFLLEMRPGVEHYEVVHAPEDPGAPIAAGRGARSRRPAAQPKRASSS